MDHYPLAYAGVKQCAGGAGDIGDVRLAVGRRISSPLNSLASSSLMAVVKMLQRRQDQRPVARVALARHQIEDTS